MITVYPDYSKQIASRAAGKATELTDPMRQLASLVDVARSDDADQGVVVSLDMLGRIRPYLADLEERGGHVRYVITRDSHMPLEAAWTQAVAGQPVVELASLDQADQQAYESEQRSKPIKEHAEYSDIRRRAHDRPGAKPVVPMVAVDPTDPDNWED